MRKVTYLSLALAAGLIAAATFLPTQTSGHQKSKFQRTDKPIPNQYIVMLNEDYVGREAEAPVVEAEAQYLSSLYGGDIRGVYSTALKGYSVTMPPMEAEALSHDDRVKMVQEDGTVSLASTQLNAGWNLDRVDQRNLPLDNSYSYTGNGSGAHVYVVDTGIRTTHVEFGGRANVVFDAINDGNLDCNGHGTHVAGIVGSATYGVAKGVSLHSARVLRCDGSGSISDIVAAVDWITAHRINPAVVNISITAAGAIPPLEDAITTSIASGVVYTISAGNSAQDACGYSPGRTPNAITVGATAQADDRALFSNFGPCVDIFAPGYEIVSLGNGSDTATRQLNGTSMSAPLVAGVAAIYRAGNPTASSSTVISSVLSGATTGVVTNIDTTSPNRLVYSWLSGAPSPTPTPTPTATPTPTPTATPTASPTPAPSGSVKIRKRAITSTGSTSATIPFPYAATNISTSNFSLTSNQEFVDPNAPTNGQTIAVTEADVSGWQLTSVSCVELAADGTPTSPNSTVDLANHRANIKVESGETVTCTFTSEELAPSAAHASVAGRIVDNRGMGVRGVTLELLNASTGETYYATTNSFGFYVFSDLEVSTFYVVTAFDSKRFSIPDNQRSFTLNDDLVNVDFVAVRINE